MIYEGDTVRLMVNFLTFNGLEVDPENIKLKIFDNEKLFIEEIDINANNKVEQGKYFYDYTPVSNKSFIFEFTGIYNDKTILSRGKVDVKFI